MGLYVHELGDEEWRALQVEWGMVWVEDRGWMVGGSGCGDGYSVALYDKEMCYIDGDGWTFG